MPRTRKPGPYVRKPRVKSAGPVVKALVRGAAEVIQENVEATKLGRPPTYHEGFCHIARQACIINSTSPELAAMFGVNQTAVETWMTLYPNFLSAIKTGKANADEQIEKSLAHRANGYSHPEEVLLTVAGPRGEGSSVERHKTTKHYPPDPTSMIFWLKNRKPAAWRDKPPEEDGSEPAVPVAVTIDFKDAKRR